MNRGLALLLAAALAGPAWGLSRQPPKQPERKTPLMEWKGTFCAVTTPAYRIITTQKEWNALWAQIGQSAPAVDFKAYFALAVFLGARNTGGYSVSFQDPVDETAAMALAYKINSPAPDTMTMQVLTQPYAVRLYPKKNKPIKVSAPLALKP